ncbi:MAG: 30S ribosomal protein S20 [Holosporaceae bacterium]|jgi:small subunit ribosomal protein S20|nr:30S ribosomal protein S20 [Holosporaceae bacterium]
MANHKSALKRAKQNEKRAEQNKSMISRIKTFIKKFVSNIGSGDAASKFSEAQSAIQKGASKGVLHKNAASRKVSRLNKMVKSAEFK